MKKIIAFALAACLCLALAVSASADGSVYYLNFKPEQDAQWQELAKLYTEQTGVPVTVVTAASGNYETTLMSEIEKSDPPTLFQVNGPVGLANWKDYCYDLKDADITKHLTSDSFALKEGDTVYGVAYVIETYGLIANTKLLEKAGYKASDITNFETLKKVADDIQARKDELGVDGAFTSAGMDGSSDWRFKTHLANMPIYYEYKADGIGSTEAIKGTYLDNYKAIWDLYITDSTCDPKLLASKTGNDAVAEFVGEKAVFYQNGTWAWNDVSSLGAENVTMLPIYIGAEGEENQGLCTGTENYWCVNGTAKQEDIDATLAFMNWVITSDEGRKSMSQDMGFVTPFDTFTGEYQSANPFVQIDAQYTAEGKTPVSWNFATIPSEAWKDGDAVTSIAYVIETYGIIYNKELLSAAGYTQDDIKGFADLKKVADDIQARKAELGVDGAFTSAGMDGSSDWRFKTHLANLPIYYEYKADGISSTDAIKGTYLDNYKQIWDLYITDSTCDPTLLASKTGNDAVAEFVGKKAVFYQNGTWAYNDVKDLGDDNLGMLPIYIGVDGEENQGLCTGSENFWCVNNNSSDADIQATLDFLYWCVTSEAGTSAMADKMGFVIPFKKAKDSTNPLITIANQYVADGKTSVDWCFSTMPSEEWKNGVGSALTAYAAGTGDWDGVVTAFVDGWAKEYKLANG